MWKHLEIYDIIYILLKAIEKTIVVGQKTIVKRLEPMVDGAIEKP